MQTSGVTLTTENESELEQEQQPTKPGLSQRIQGWFPWGTPIPFASQLSHSDNDPFLELGDGMAPFIATNNDTTTSTTPSSSSRQRWYNLRQQRRSGTSPPPPLSSSLDARPVQVDHPTLQLVKQRILSKSKPGNRKDDFKLGLAIEGGGMRGCVSGGALQALSDLGLRDIFDAVYGSSAGAINATYFLANQRDGVHIYHNHIASEEFIDLKRLWSRKPGTPAALNLDLLLGPVIEDIHPLDFDAVLSSDIPLNVVASSLVSLSPLLLQKFTDKNDLIACLRASATVPEVAGGPVHHRGHSMVDAAVFEPVPFRSAIADGCTHVLVLCTRPPPPTRKSYLNQAITYAMETVVKKAVLSPEYMVPAWHAELEAMMKDGVHHDDMLLKSLDDDAHELPWFAGSHVYPVYPKAGASSFSPLCIDVPTLKRGVTEGRRSVLSIVDALLMSEPSMASVLDLSQFKETANILPLLRRSASGRRASERLWKKYMNEFDFSSHAVGEESTISSTP